MIVVASENGAIGLEVAMDILRAGGSALDAVEAAARVVEANVEDHSVGLGGYPNAEGVVELDASIMEGATRRSGAVAALQNYIHAISVARAVMEYLPQHVLLVGAGAERFARDRGFEAANLLTPAAEAVWQRQCSLTEDDANAQKSSEERDMIALARALTDPRRTSGTVNFLAQDAHGNIASAVSTSGWSFKFPGRVGDSPIIGAGNYCDNRYGACACTGIGELAIRGGTARSVVTNMRYGLDLDRACRDAMEDLRTIPLPPGFEPVMSLVAIDRDGNPTAYSSQRDRCYVWQTPDLKTYETSPRELSTLI